MKITKGKRSGVSVTLGKTDTKKWEDAGGQGVLFRRQVMAEARAFAKRKAITGNIEVYAAKSAGGWTAEVERIE